MGFKFIKSVNGRPLILMDNYTYTFASAAHKKGTKRWICTSRSQRDCKAKVILNGDQEIVLAQTDHNHLPPQYFCLNGEYIKRTVLTRGVAHWICTSSRSKNCKARLVLNSNNEIDSCNLEHNHQAPSYRCVRGQVQVYNFSAGKAADSLPELFLLFSPRIKQRHCAMVLCFENRQAVQRESSVAQYVFTHRGHRLIIYQGYTYCIQHAAASTEKWKCVSRTSKNCKAKIVVDATGNVVKELEFIKTIQGRTLCLYKGYSYCHYREFQKGTNHWRCSSRQSRNCRARIILCDENMIMASDDHNHDPPHYVKTNGVYIKVS
ncbi:hypothetical protein HW555_007937 [Spodoptera exigua]|uniref:FLYWCH-type domain-containing protein n=1 Tax=Spodoptera exigua TaxID=7107 RepID=A0A835L4V9_SPOEX|nr:hypothetical protein HW555_007937 [Spodoptera exigua]